MIKIGFLDYYLDEWHANNYPQFLRNVGADDMEVAFAYGDIDSPKGGLTTDEWCKKFGVTRCRTIEELIEKSDVLLVLSPDNCEMHERLCQLPLRSKKLCYVDKTFAPDFLTAKRIFKIADDSGTPCYSTSALRFADEYKKIDTSDITGIASWGPMNFEIYAIHQLEPLAMLMKVPARRVMYLPNEKCYTMNIEFMDGRFASISSFENGSPFMMNISHKNSAEVVNIESDYFANFIRELAEFYRTGIVKVPHEETLTIMALRGAGLEAQRKPCEWIPVLS